MSDDAASSSAAAASSSTTHQHHYYHPADDGEDRQQAAAQMAERQRKNRQLFNKKHGDLLADLQRELDINIYAQLSIIYYMEYAVSPLPMSTWQTAEADAIVAAPSPAS